MTQTAAELKPVESMTAAECKAELEARLLVPAAGAKVAELRAAVAAARVEAEAAVVAAIEDVVDGELVDEDDGGSETAMVPPAVADEVGAAIALREQTVAPQLALPTPQEFNAAQSVALAIANTKMVPEAYRGRADDVLAAILFGREIGLGPMTALRDIYMIDGRPALAAHRQLGALRRGGVTILESDSTMDGAWIRAKRTDTGEIMRVEFTWADAELVTRKGKPLVDGDNWRSYRKDMLWARCVGRLTRRLGPDLIGGLPPYVAEEVADFSGWGVEYGEQGEVRVGPRAAPTVAPYRQEFPDYNWPESWAELMPRLAARIGDEAAAKEWVRQAVVHATGQEPPALSVAKRRLMFSKCSSALAALDQAADGGDPAFDTNNRAAVAAAFAPRLEGALLDGPPWRLGPNEMERPTHEEWLATIPAEPAAEAPPKADVCSGPNGCQAAVSCDDHCKIASGEEPAGEAVSEGDAAAARAWEDLTPEEQAEAEQIQFGAPEGGPS